jgi:NADPH:quinone reductase-like Zn-dependent oxidoreductase
VTHRGQGWPLNPKNPTDWKQSSKNSPPGAIHGCDLCGTVVSIGPNVANADIKIGVRVAAAVHGSQFPDKGASAEYARVASDLCWIVPEGVRAEDAATFGVGFLTAAQVGALDSLRRLH